VGGEHRSLPHGALLELAVAQQAEDSGGGGRGGVRRTDGRAVEPKREREAVGEREALPQRAGRDLHAGQLARVRVPLQARSEGAERRELLTRQVAGLCQRSVEDRSGVALREHEAVALGPVGACRVVTHDAEVE
jgi:hypothetical protein